MKISKTKSYDLYRNGNYIRSFSSWNEITRYFSDKYEYRKSYDWSDENMVNDRILKELNRNRFHVMESSRLSFDK